LHLELFTLPFMVICGHVVVAAGFSLRVFSAEQRKLKLAAVLEKIRG